MHFWPKFTFSKASPSGKDLLRIWPHICNKMQSHIYNRCNCTLLFSLSIFHIGGTFDCVAPSSFYHARQEHILLHGSLSNISGSVQAGIYYKLSCSWTYQYALNNSQQSRNVFEGSFAVQEIHYVFWCDAALLQGARRVKAGCLWVTGGSQAEGRGLQWIWRISRWYGFWDRTSRINDCSERCCRAS